ncbi:odorant receptor 4-like [Venturia canescens]|uniref:odorant receptor 4-like n=1 Tax=Venturia canescens TaxID=32260 RepID=UPI001C9CF5F3|nr:odorant receptor 4-like [Venturia canescens]XP_043282245.1 odorant receptor 4-like [Venturia canescens]
MEHLERDWMSIKSEKDREIMVRNVNVGRQLTMICALFMYTGGLSYHTVMPWWQGNEINEFNETIRPLVYPGYDMFVDSQKSPVYEIIFYTHCFASFVMYTITTTACNLAATFVAHACAQIQIIMSRLETLYENIDEADKLPEHRLGLVIESHVRVLRFTSMIEMLLREICLVEVVASSIIICLLEYYCLTEWNNSDSVAIITYFVLLLSFNFNIFIFCHIGELLKEQCGRIGNAAFTIEWYRLPGKTGVALVLIIAMANFPRNLTAGGMMELSISSFGAIIKSSAVYFNMLRTMAN